MNLFTPEQIKELSVIFGIEPVNPESIAKVRDGSIRKGESVWWWGEYGPEFVKSDVTNSVSLGWWVAGAAFFAGLLIGAALAR